MGLRQVYTVDLPVWAEKCKKTSLSKLLSLIANKHAHHVSVRMVNAISTAYVVVASHESRTTFSYWSIPLSHWLAISHIMETIPTDCPCWCCKWRRKRKRYMEIHDFSHLYMRMV